MSLSYQNGLQTLHSHLCEEYAPGDTPAVQSNGTEVSIIV